MLSVLFRHSIKLLPWRLRASINRLPLVAPLQRWMVSHLLDEEEFVYRVDAGPARGLVYPIRLPQDKGVWTGTYELQFASAIAKAVTPGAVCLDIGGWHGFYTGVIALAGASQVFVFEPLPANCARIRRLIELNPRLSIELIEAAVADRSGSAPFQTMSEDSMGKLAESPFQPEQRSREQVAVRLVNLDELLAEARITVPSVIKVDVEGGEMLVLRGAMKLLREHKPTLFMELHSPELARDCRKLLEELGYEITLLKKEGGVDSAVCHFVARPRERLISRRQDSTENESRGSAFDIPILLYHHLVADNDVNSAAYEISIRQFEQQLDLLKGWGFTLITFATLLRIMKGLEPQVKRTAIISFDDGFRSFFKLALPALKRREVPATVFVPAGEIGGTNRWDAAAGYEERQLMDEGELREITAAGMEIGSHGWAHRRLTECSETEAREEIYRSRERLAELGFHADFFAYPFGDHSPRCAAMVREAGYQAAASIFSDAPFVTANRFAMRRIYVHAGDTPFRFRCKLSGAYLRYKAMRGMPEAAAAQA